MLRAVRLGYGDVVAQRQIVPVEAEDRFVVEFGRGVIGNRPLILRAMHEFAMTVLLAVPEASDHATGAVVLPFVGVEMPVGVQGGDNLVAVEWAAGREVLFPGEFKSNDRKGHGGAPCWHRYRSFFA